MKAINFSFLLGGFFFITSLYSMDSNPPAFPAPGIDNALIAAILSDWQQWLEAGNQDQNQKTQEISAEKPQHKDSAYDSIDDSSEKNYKSNFRICKMCHKRIRGAMRLHMYTHTNEKPYECSEGDYESTQLYNCKRHIVTFHEPALEAFVIETLQEGNATKKHKVDYPALMSCSHCPRQFYNKHEHKRHQQACEKNPK